MLNKLYYGIERVVFLDNEQAVVPGSPINGGLKSFIGESSLLDHQLKTLTFVMIFVYTSFQIFMCVFNYKTESRFCDENIKLESYTQTVNVGAIACLLFNCIMQIYRIISYLITKGKKNFGLIHANFSLLVLSIVTLSSELLTLIGNYGGICKDVFGVYSPGAQWSEWLVTVPYLFYLCTAVEHKKSLDRFDWIMLSGLTLVIFSGFILNVGIPKSVGILVLCIAVMTFSVVLFLIYMNYMRAKSRFRKVNLRSNNFFKEKQTMRKASLLVKTACILPFYPLIYFLTLSGAIKSISTSWALTMGGSMFGKLFFSNLVIDSHINMLYEFLIKTNNKNMGNLDLRTSSNSTSMNIPSQHQSKNEIVVENNNTSQNSPSHNSTLATLKEESEKNTKFKNSLVFPSIDV